LLFFYTTINAQNKQEFQTPPQSAKPRVWWHWMNGNISKEGDVKNLAEVYLNGKYVQIVWKKPFVVDITNQFNIGKNTLEVKVINSWVNRLVGDAQPGANKITFIPMPLFRADSKTEPAGLLGPVTIHKLK